MVGPEERVGFPVDGEQLASQLVGRRVPDGPERLRVEAAATELRERRRENPAEARRSERLGERRVMARSVGPPGSSFGDAGGQAFETGRRQQGSLVGRDPRRGQFPDPPGERADGHAERAVGPPPEEMAVFP